MTCKSMVRCRDLELNSTPQGCDGSKAKVVVGVRRGRKSQSGSGVAGEDVLNTSTVKTCRLH